MDSTTSSSGRGRFRVPDRPSAAEKQQAREVSLRRIAGLFTPYRWSVLGVVAIIVAVVFWMLNSLVVLLMSRIAARFNHWT